MHGRQQTPNERKKTQTSYEKKNARLGLAANKPHSREKGTGVRKVSQPFPSKARKLEKMSTLNSTKKDRGGKTKTGNGIRNNCKNGVGFDNVCGGKKGLKVKRGVFTLFSKAWTG